MCSVLGVERGGVGRRGRGMYCLLYTGGVSGRFLWVFWRKDMYR